MVTVNKRLLMLYFRFRMFDFRINQLLVNNKVPINKLLQLLKNLIAFLETEY